jgi:hypothetical protein
LGVSCTRRRLLSELDSSELAGRRSRVARAEVATRSPVAPPISHLGCQWKAKKQKKKKKGNWALLSKKSQREWSRGAPSNERAYSGGRQIIDQEP